MPTPRSALLRDPIQRRVTPSGSASIAHAKTSGSAISLPWYYQRMSVTKSRITGQGQISVPADVRRRLGVGPGSVLEWEFVHEQCVVRRAGRYSSADVQQALFPTPPRPRSVEEIEKGIALHMRKKHARR